MTNCELEQKSIVKISIDSWYKIIDSRWKEIVTLDKYPYGCTILPNELGCDAVLRYVIKKDRKKKGGK